MADMSNYLKTAITNYFFRPSSTQPTRPTSHVASLWSAITDAAAGLGTELTGNGYLRSAVTFGAVAIPSGLFATNFTVVFPTATADWLAATHYGIHDHLGNLVQALKALPAPQTVLTGNHAECSAGAWTVTLS